MAFPGKIWDIRRDHFDYNGTEIAREYVDHTGAVAVLALDDLDRVLLIKQYRHPVRMREWELPAGLLDEKGENPLVAAQRELAEETDLAATAWHLLTEFFTSPGGSNESIRVYLARHTSPVEHDFDRTAEEADMEIRWVPLADCVDAVLASRVQNPILALAIMTAAASKSRGWASLLPPEQPWPRHPLNRAG